MRAFPDAAGAAANPGGDIDDLETELILADLEVVERRLERLEAQIKKKRTDADVKEQAVLLKVKPALEAETPIRAMGLTDGRGAGPPRLHVPLAEADPALPEPVREGDRPGAALVESFELADGGGAPGARASAGSPR